MALPEHSGLLELRTSDEHGLFVRHRSHAGRAVPQREDPEQLAHKKEAYEREMAFYNCTPQTSAFTLGLAASMEEQYAADRENFNPETINAVKTSLMGPLSGVGDSFFQGTVRLIAFWSGHLSGTAGQRSGPHSGYDHLHRPLGADYHGLPVSWATPWAAST